MEGMNGFANHSIAKEIKTMKTFTIDQENNITAYAATEQVPDGAERFTSEKELGKLAASWPAERLIEIWNSFAGVTPFDDLKPVKKFTDRKTAVARVWKAIQRVEATPAPQGATGAPKKAKASKQAKAAKAAPTTREGSKKAKVLELIRRPNGATLRDIIEATDWQAHSVRGFISTLGKKTGLKIESIKREDGERAYLAQ